ncbi:probable G-protein coupled receptor Mth-like 14 [Eupeodes corollae]|uniref:probable G-protein coupled receptor Mth-like 14 n=1 Tax=Eupeodes corollae TaxID=290404 RepID=UPI00249301EC|nr:probable G-protein coupled receptor Mth-like 14 [Eupeodes corollae]XP_055904542.1 probable G-protein coupled receptor Mth-like 14 [Eupeodes corollae]
MAHFHRIANKCSPKGVLVITLTLIIGLISAQNITEQNSTLAITTTSTTTTTTNPPPSSSSSTSTSSAPPKTLALDISTVLPSTNNETAAPVESNSTFLQPRLLQDILTSSEKPPDNNASTQQPPSKDIHSTRNIPPDCSHRSKNRKQPKNSPTSRLRKCCPNGETLVSEENGIETVEICKAQVGEFAPEVLSVELYENCIEDLEIPVKLDIEVGNPCIDGSMYSASSNDRLMVIQDGSLLIMDNFLNESYTVESNYCLDTNIETGELYAIVCVSATDEHLSRGQTILYTCFMIVSIPCLCLVSFLHFAIKELRSVHGLSLGVMSSCMAIGFTLHTFAQFSDAGKSWIGFAVQFFMLAYFFWLFCLCCNVVVHVCYYLPNKSIINRRIRYCHFNTYCLIAFSFPFALVLWTNYKGLPGMPSYFYQGFTESVRESQRYFIPPVTGVLILSFFLLVISFFGYKYLDKINFRYATYQQVYSQTTLPIHIYDQESYQEIRKDTKCICCLYIVTIITWILEVVTFYSPGQDNYTAFMEIINALQGAFILMIFIVVRRRRNAIVRWWHGRGPHGLTAVPMKDLIPAENRPPPISSS